MLGVVEGLRERGMSVSIGWLSRLKAQEGEIGWIMNCL